MTQNFVITDVQTKIATVTERRNYKPLHISAGCINIFMAVQQLRNQSAEKVTHVKERLLDQAVLLFNCIPFLLGNFS